MTNWEAIDGSFTDDLMELPLDRFCNRTLAWLKARMTQANYDSFIMRVEMPPPEAVNSSAWSDEETMAAFQAFSEPARG